jgi:glycosyltransferase involved in cell wall biosynthesis
MPLTWALAIATYNRPEALRRSVLCALEQTRPPCEIIIVDSSPSQPSSQQDIQDLVLQSGANVRVHYLRSPIAQQTIQRNLAIDASSAEVLFMIDDDAYMYPGCAQKVMTVFEADAGKQIAAVGPAPAANPPANGGEPLRALGIPLPRRAAERWAYALFELWYWPRKQRYPHFDLSPVPLPIRRAQIIHGYRMIVRRDIASTCRFDENLAAGLHEDLDASYRFAQHGALVDLDLPLIYHDRAPRPAEQPRKGSIQRYSWIAGHVYLARQYFGHGLYVRLHAYFSMWRYLPLDLINAIRRGNAAQLHGTIEGLKAAWRLAMAPAERIGPIYAQGCRAYREQLIRRSQ